MRQSARCLKFTADGGKRNGRIRRARAAEDQPYREDLVHVVALRSAARPGIGLPGWNCRMTKGSPRNMQYRTLSAQRPMCAPADAAGCPW
jgi:hypothetical protein